MVSHWLMKTEPDTFSIDDLARVKVEPWTGVRNYMARNLMRDREPDTLPRLLRIVFDYRAI